MKIIESFLQGKTNQETCEDGIFVSDDFIAVIDGVSSKTNYLLDGKTTGKLATERIIEVLGKINQEATLADFIEEINYSYIDFYKKNDFPYNKEKYGLQAMTAVFSKAHNEIWLIGDCQVKINGEIYFNTKLSDDILSEMRSLISYTEMSSMHLNEDEYFVDDDSARLQIVPWIVKTTRFANDASTPLGYSVINGKSIPESLIKVIDVPSNYKEDIILTTDGYPAVEDTLDESEDVLRRIFKEDPYLINQFKSTKGIASGNNSFDDRAYIRFKLK